MSLSRFLGFDAYHFDLPLQLLQFKGVQLFHVRHLFVSFLNLLLLLVDDVFVLLRLGQQLITFFFMHYFVLLQVFVHLPVLLLEIFVCCFEGGKF